MPPVEQPVRPVTRGGLILRVVVAVLGIGLLLNGSLRMSDDVWPFGPLSQYAFSPPPDATIVITRVEGQLADGRRIDLPLRVGTAGISRAEIEARIPAILSDPSLLRSVADGWTWRTPERTAVGPAVAGPGRDPPGRRSQGPDPDGRDHLLDGDQMISKGDDPLGPRSVRKNTREHARVNAVVRWFAPVLPESRVAILRTVLYAFVLLDIHTFVRDPIPLSRHPELYSPLLLARLLHLPPPSVPLTVTLYVVLLISCVVAAANRLPRVAGVVVAAAFTWWTAIGMSYGKVDHDHMALVVALWVLPTVGADRRSLAQSAGVGAGRLGAQMHPDRGDLHLLPVRR